MNFQQNIMQSSFTVLALAILSSADAIIFESPRSCDGTKNLTVRKSPYWTNPTDHTQNTQMPTRTKSWNGSMIITVGILKYLSVNCMASSALSMAISGIPNHYIAFTGNWVIPVQLLQPRTNANHSLTTPRSSFCQSSIYAMILSVTSEIKPSEASNP